MVKQSSQIPSNGQLPRLDLIELRELLRATAVREKAVNTLALKLGVSGQFLGDIINGKKKPGPKLLRALRLREMPQVYEPIEDDAWTR